MFGYGDNSVDFALSHDHISAWQNISLCDNLNVDDGDDGNVGDFFFFFYSAHLQLIREHNSLEKMT